MAINYTKQYPSWAIALRQAMEGFQIGHQAKMDRDRLALAEKGMEYEQSSDEQRRADMLRLNEQRRTDDLFFNEQRRADEQAKQADERAWNERVLTENRERWEAEAAHREWMRKMAEDERRREDQTRGADAQYLVGRIGITPGADAASAIRYASQLAWASRLSPEARKTIHARLDEEEAWGRVDQQIEQWTTPTQGQDGQSGMSALTPEQGDALRSLRAMGVTPRGVAGAAEKMIYDNSVAAAEQAESQNALMVLDQKIAMLPVGDARRAYLLAQAQFRQRMPWASASERSREMAELTAIADGYKGIPGPETESEKADPFVLAEFKSLLEAAAIGDPMAQEALQRFKEEHGLAAPKTTEMEPEEQSEPSGMSRWLPPGFGGALRSMFGGTGDVPAQSNGNAVDVKPRENFAAEVAERAKADPQMTNEKFLALMESAAEEYGIDPATISVDERRKIAELYRGSQ